METSRRFYKNPTSHSKIVALFEALDDMQATATMPLRCRTQAYLPGRDWVEEYISPAPQIPDPPGPKTHFVPNFFSFTDTPARPITTGRYIAHLPTKATVNGDFSDLENNTFIAIHDTLGSGDATSRPENSKTIWLGKVVDTTRLADGFVDIQWWLRKATQKGSGAVADADAQWEPHMLMENNKVVHNKETYHLTGHDNKGGGVLGYNLKIKTGGYLLAKDVKLIKNVDRAE